ncbi:MAG: hypothetical protein Q4G22_02500 [Paracoccus sp. (in: a-proteobacteria)]|nr:hypothetical protein [Paracoccus sp. (in: a-proteobacteria)]MDO5630688.1 hypothetical protein [Paracoccus sp. (in: a-proteobacteria)]
MLHGQLGINLPDGASDTLNPDQLYVLRAAWPIVPVPRSKPICY